MNRAALFLFACLFLEVVFSAPIPPYPRSQIFTEITFNETTLERKAQGSDIWSTTWAANGDLLTTWGDGGGFEGSDSLGRVSIGVGAIHAMPPDWKGKNLWGGVNPLSKQVPTTGKGTILASPSAIYLYVSEQGKWDRSRLWKSSDFGLRWTDLGWIFPQTHKAFAFPGFIDFGKAQELSPDGYIYAFSDNDPRRLTDRKLYLFRVKPTGLEKLENYEYFSGTTNAPSWTKNIEERKPVFADPTGVSWGTTCVYHKASRRYLLCVSASAESGEWGLYESSQPWGPWSTVGYREDFPAWTYAPAEKKRPAYLHSFPSKWISDDGKTMWCIFDRGDHFNLARCALKISLQ